MSLTKVSYSMITGEYVNILDFGAVGDGVTDDTAAFQAAAVSIDASGKALYIPTGEYIISEQIVFQQPPNIYGESYSPPIVGTFPSVGGTPYAKKGSLIISKVPNDYAFLINPPSNNVYIRGTNITNIHLLADTANTTGGGIGMYNCGWQGYMNNVVIEGFKYHGLKLSQVQDSLFDQIAIINCGTDNLYPALWVTGGSNLMEFHRIQLEQNDFNLQVDNSFDIKFIGAHIECGDYPIPPTQGNVIPRYSSVRVLGTQCKFIGCYFACATLANTMAKYSISAADCPYFINVTGGPTTFQSCSIGCGFNNGRLLNMSTDGFVSNCDFFNLCVETNSINLNGNILFSNNGVSFNDYNFTTAMNGLSVAFATVDNNILSSLNSSQPNKTSGAIFDSNGTGRIGKNQLIIQKYNLIFGGAPIQISYNISGNESQDFTGTIDAQKYDPCLRWAANTTGTLTNITNFMGNQQIRIMNNSSGTFTITNGGNIALKGAVNASMTQNGDMIQLQANPFTGVLNEVFRNF